MSIKFWDAFLPVVFVGIFIAVLVILASKGL